MQDRPKPLTRRSFVQTTSACAAHAVLMATPFPAAARALWSRRARGQVVARESFGRLEELGEGLYALISTPLSGDYTTVSNGGIVAGRSAVLVVEAFQTPEGARWIADRARELTGRWPTHVLITHCHGDHSAGLEGYFGVGEEEGALETPSAADGPRAHVTPTTRKLATERLPTDASDSLRRRWADVVMVAEDQATSLDLGDRQVQLVPRLGHTPSDVTVEIPGEGLTWCGDLFWNGMFPNYVDAIPSRLSRAVRALRGDARSVYVPGHGPLADPEDLDRYIAVIDGLEETARTARREGWTSEEAGQRHRIPPTLGDWTLFNPSYFQRAVEAWMKEWEGAG